MTTPSKAAKAAAIMAFTSGVASTDKAVELYDAIANSEERFSGIFERFPGAQIWGRLGQLHDVEWWEEVMALADSIDEAIAYFKEH